MHTVREFCTLAFHYLGIELEWQGSGVDEKGVDKATGQVLVEVDPKYFRPCEVEQLLGDPTKARTMLGWNPPVCRTGKNHGGTRHEVREETPPESGTGLVSL